MDAKDWLDTAFLDSGDNKNLQAAIDRVLIQRANEIGDFPEIIFLYQHLEQLYSPFSKGGKGDLNSPPVLGGVARSDGVVEWITDHGLRITDYANYSQILFYLRKDREDFLAFLCNARTLFCKVYGFLDSEDDLKKVKERIDEVKEQIAAGENPFTEKYSVSGNRYSVKRKKKISKSSNLKIDKFGNIEKSPRIILEDLLMQADWKLKQNQKSKGGTNYFLAYQMATGTFANIEYDGTSTENAAIIGMIQTELKIKPKFPISDFKFQVDNSYRAAETTLQLYLAATNDVQRAEYDTEVALSTLPLNHKLIKRYIKQLVLACNDKNDTGEFIDISEMILAQNPYAIYLYPLLCKAYIKLGNSVRAYDALIRAFIYEKPDKFRIEHFKNLYPELTDNQMEMFIAILKKARITVPAKNSDKAKYRKIKMLPGNRILLGDQLFSFN